MPDAIELAGNTICLRPFATGDRAAMYAAARESIQHVSPWLPWCHPDYSLADSASWIEYATSAWQLGDEYNYAIVARDAGSLLGGCGLNRIDKDYRTANLGYWVRATALGRGVAAEATRLLAEYAIRTLHLNRIEIVAAVGNAASLRVAEAAGARREGIARQRILIRQVAHDAAVYSLVKEDFDQPRR